MERNFTMIRADKIAISSGLKNPTIRNYNFLTDKQFIRKFNKNPKFAIRYLIKRLKEYIRKNKTVYILLSHTDIQKASNYFNFTNPLNFIDYLILMGYKIVFEYIEADNTYKIYRSKLY